MLPIVGHKLPIIRLLATLLCEKDNVLGKLSGGCESVRITRVSIQFLESLHSAKAKAITEFAEETRAEVLRGALRYPSESGGWQLSDIFWLLRSAREPHLNRSK